MFKTKGLNAGLLLARITVGGLLLLHGLRKVEKPKKTVDHMTKVLIDNNLPPVLANGVFLGEVVAPIGLIIGYRTRLMSSVIVFNMLTAVYTVNLPKIDKRDKKGAWELEVQAFYLFGSLALFLTGGGKFAISTDNKWD